MRERSVPTSSSMMAGSLPPNSTQTGVRAFAAEVQTAWATGREPMKVKCEILGCEVRCSAAEGQQYTVCTRFGEWPHAARAPLTILVK